VQVVLSTAILCPFALVAGTEFPATAAERWSLAYIAVFPSLGAYLFWNLALKTTAPATAGNYLNLMVVFTAAITVIMGIPVSVPQVIGGLLVIAGVLMASRPKQPLEVRAA
jgi:drug/metabolite transporter (DMT)-like permease